MTRKNKVPETKPKEPKIQKLTKTQKELFNLHMQKITTVTKQIVDLIQTIGNDLLEKDLHGFADELSIDLVGETWNFDQRTMQFTKMEDEK